MPRKLVRSKVVNSEIPNSSSHQLPYMCDGGDVWGGVGLAHGPSVCLSPSASDPTGLRLDSGLETDMMHVGR